MKIALVILHADPARGGAEGYTVHLAADLAGQGHEVTLVATSFAPRAAADGAGARVRHFPLGTAGGTRLRQYKAFVDAVDRHLADVSYDVVHAISPIRKCDVYHPQAGIAAEAIARGHLRYTGLRRYFTRLATRFNPKRQFVASIERDLLSGANAPFVFCVSDAIKQAVREFYRLDEQKLVRLPNAVNVRRFDPTSSPEARREIRERWKIGPDQVVALIVAQDFRRKGLRHAIEAVARVHDPRLILLVVGKPDATPYRRLARSLRVDERVFFVGPASDTCPYYAAADFFVLPTHNDPCSIVVVEALAMGLPVVTTRQNGASELFHNGREGFVLDDPADVEALAKAMTTLLDPGQRTEMHRSAMALRASLSQEAHLDSILTLYRHLDS